MLLDTFIKIARKRELNDTYRDVMFFHFVSGMKIAEIADLLGRKKINGAAAARPWKKETDCNFRNRSEESKWKVVRNYS